MASEDRRALFARWAAGYEDAVARSEAQASFPFAGYSRVLERVWQLAGPRPGMRVLDLGVGTGSLAHRFLDQGCRVVGVDWSPEMLARARKRCPGLETIEADFRGRDWLCGLGRFERIVSTYAFHEIPVANGAAHLRLLMDRALEKRGRVVLGDVCFPDAETRERARRRWDELWDPDEHYWAADEAVLALREHGLKGAFEQVSECGGTLVIERPSV